MIISYNASHIQHLYEELQRMLLSINNNWFSKVCGHILKIFSRLINDPDADIAQSVSEVN